MTFLWPNGYLYNFTYGNPNISNYSYNDSTLTINGINFSNMAQNVSITINNNQISPNDIKSIDHNTIRINYIQKYANKSILKINVCALLSNEFPLFFRPVALAINSVPKSKGGLITITGERLSSLNNTDPIVKIGDSVCKNSVPSKDNQIICEVKPLADNSPSTNLPISISIDGIQQSSNSLVFNYDVPMISNDYTLPEGVLNLKGNCFGNTAKTKILINDIETNVTNLKINERETELSFQLLLKSANVSIIVNGVKSYVIQVDGSFYAKVNESSPSINGQTVEYTLYNIKSTNYDSSATITFRNDNSTITGSLKSSATPPAADKSIQTFLFKIPKGCGESEITIKIGDQSSPSKFYYKTPTIDKCLIGSNQSIVCDGNFSQYQSLYQSKQIKFKLSNNYIEDNQVTFDSSHLLFPLIPEYESSDLFIEVCHLLSEPYKLDIQPTLKDVVGTQLKTNGGTTFIKGQNFNSNCSNNTYFECENESTKISCQYQNYTSISCDLLLEGPIDRECQLVFNGVKSNDSIKITFYPPSVLTVANTIINTKGGILTIVGDQFYNNSNDITILVDQQSCFNPVYINSTPNNNNNDNNNNNNKNIIEQPKGKLKAGQIAGLVVGVVIFFIIAFTIILYFAVIKDVRRKKRKNKEAIEMHENELEVHKRVSEQIKRLQIQSDKSSISSSSSSSN